MHRAGRDPHLFRPPCGAFHCGQRRRPAPGSGVCVQLLRLRPRRGVPAHGGKHPAGASEGGSPAPWAKPGAHCRAGYRSQSGQHGAGHPPVAGALGHGGSFRRSGRERPVCRRPCHTHRSGWQTLPGAGGNHQHLSHHRAGAFPPGPWWSWCSPPPKRKPLCCGI